MNEIVSKVKFQHYVIFVVAIVSFLVAFLSSATSIALPEIAKYFGMSNILQNWVATIYLLTIAIFSVPCGKLAGRYGLKKSLVISVIIFLIGSFGSALANSDVMLLCFRAIQGVASALLNVSSMAMLVAALPPEDRGKALGLNVAGVYIGLSIAPLLGGVLTHNFGWQSIFWITIPFGILALLFTISKITNEWTTCADEPFDTKGSILYGIAILLFMYGFTIINGFIGQIFVVIGLILFVAFGIYELRDKFPVFNIRLFKNSKFLSSNIASLISYLATFVITYVLNYHLQYIEGMNSQSAGLILVVTPLMMAILAPVAGKLSDKIDPQKLAAFGMFLVTIALGILCFLNESMPLYVIIFAMFLQGIGYGFFSSPNTNAIMSSVPPKETPTASAAVSTMRVIGQTLSLSMLTVIFAIIMGDVPIIAQYYPLLIESSRIACVISTILCIVAVFASLVGLKSKDNYNF